MNSFFSLHCQANMVWTEKRKILNFSTSLVPFQNKMRVLRTLPFSYGLWSFSVLFDPPYVAIELFMVKIKIFEEMSGNELYLDTV